MPVNVTVGKPKNNVYFRCHPDPAMSLDASVLVGADGSDDFYFVTPVMLNHHAILPRLRKVTIAVVYTWPGGAISLWPVPFAEESRIACWKSARAAFELSQDPMGSNDLEFRPARLRRGGRRGHQHRTVVAGRSRYREALEARFRRQDHHHPGTSLCHAAARACRIASIGFELIWHVDLSSDRTAITFRCRSRCSPRNIAPAPRSAPCARDQLLSLRRAPFDTGPDVLMTSYSIVAELSCFKVLGWPMPRHLLCSYFETIAAINGLDIVGLEEKRPSLLEACDLFAIPHMPKDHKKHLRDLILNNETYSDEQWQRDRRLQSRRRAADDPAAGSHRTNHRRAGGVIPWPLRHRGRRHGGPRHSDLDAPPGLPSKTQWQALRMFYIRRDDTFGLYDEDGSFKEDRFEALADAAAGHQLAAHQRPASSH